MCWLFCLYPIQIYKFPYVLLHSPFQLYLFKFAPPTAGTAGTAGTSAKDLRDFACPSFIIQQLAAEPIRFGL